MKWFQEKLYGHHKQMLSMSAVLYHWRTEFQDVLIFENPVFGKVLVLDGIVQLTERDNHIYHEMIAHVPLMAHGSARDVLIIGGGDGGTLKEVLKHPVDRATLVEIDGEVIDLSRRFLPDVSGGAFDDPRTTVLVMDGTRYIAETATQFDVIVIDSTDPLGPGEKLFTPAFYRACRSRLRPGGVIAVQSGAPFFQPMELDQVCGRLAASFAGVRPYLAPVPTYAGGMLALVAAGASNDVLRPPCKVLRERFGALDGKTRYYTPEVHRAAFTLAPSLAPSPLREGLRPVDSLETVI
ncbi:polyamine aminopropyltransferase [Microvirga mediterraneensis]|uniref:Polyamine aminopropyltransferase n=1 Tax=Microvirga mediterraneensis TaxID=2754695 RepID=A0A838BJF6_9HYPH|nr:polyamine aminopropyltransferase [Microvirga mediterraneensis]MBA1154646.1 polyamine aminopropyltransferase [Microvirga mediterraneensis]